MVNKLFWLVVVSTYPSEKWSESQLGWWNSQWKVIKNIPNHQPEANPFVNLLGKCLGYTNSVKQFKPLRRNCWICSSPASHAFLRRFLPVTLVVVLTGVLHLSEKCCWEMQRNPEPKEIQRKHLKDSQSNPQRNPSCLPYDFKFPSICVSLSRSLGRVDNTDGRTQPAQATQRLYFIVGLCFWPMKL